KESIYSYNRIITIMFQSFVIQAFFLDLAALVHCFHCTKHTSSFSDPVKFLKNCFLHKFCKLFDYKCALDWVLILGEPQFLVDDKLNSHCSSYRSFCRGCNGLIVSICMKGVTVVIDRIQGL